MLILCNTYIQVYFISRWNLCMRFILRCEKTELIIFWIVRYFSYNVFCFRKCMYHKKIIIYVQTFLRAINIIIKSVWLIYHSFDKLVKNNKNMCFHPVTLNIKKLSIWKILKIIIYKCTFPPFTITNFLSN